MLILRVACANLARGTQNRNPGNVGSAIFNPTEIYPKLKAFKSKLKQKPWRNQELYFAKLDIQACFDRIPQRKLVSLVEDILVEDEYRIEHHAEIIPANYYHSKEGPNTVTGQTKVFRKFENTARGENDFEEFEEFVRQKSEVGKRNVVYVNKSYTRRITRHELLEHLTEHIQCNTVKVSIPSMLTPYIELSILNSLY